MFPASVGSSSRVLPQDPTSSRPAPRAQPENPAGSAPVGGPSTRRPVPRPHRLQTGFSAAPRPPSLSASGNDEIAEIGAEPLPEYARAENLPAPPGDGPNDHLTALVRYVDTPKKRHKFKSKFSVNTGPIGSRAIAIHDLKKYLATLPIEGDGPRAEREYALRALAHKTNFLKPNSQDTAIRLLHRYLAPDLPFGPQSWSISFKIPLMVQYTENSEAGRRNIIHEEARMEILQVLLLQVEPPLPLSKKMDVLDIAFDNHDNHEKIANPENRYRLLTWMQRAIRDHRQDPTLRLTSVAQRSRRLNTRIGDAIQNDPIMMAANLPPEYGDTAPEPPAYQGESPAGGA